MDVGDWPRSLGLGQYEVAFRENGIDNKVLSKLTSQDLKELGVAALVGCVVQNEVLYPVIPAKAGIQGRSMCGQVWMPAFAGMTLVSPRRTALHFERLRPLGIVGRSCRRSGNSRIRPERPQPSPRSRQYRPSRCRRTPLSAASCLIGSTAMSAWLDPRTCAAAASSGPSFHKPIARLDA
jgi:hypothetical protein